MARQMRNWIFNLINLNLNSHMWLMASIFCQNHQLSLWICCLCRSISFCLMYLLWLGLEMFSATWAGVEARWLLDGGGMKRHAFPPYILFTVWIACNEYLYWDSPPANKTLKTQPNSPISKSQLNANYTAWIGWWDPRGVNSQLNQWQLVYHEGSAVRAVKSMTVTFFRALA